MPASDPPFRTIDDYVGQWKQNRRCCAALDGGFREWQITLAFYTALHAVNAAAAKLGERPSDHHARNDLIRFNEAFAPVRTKYLLLYRLSRFARYDPRPDDWLPAEYLTVQALADDALRPIERHVQNMLGRDLKLPELKLQS